MPEHYLNKKEIEFALKNLQRHEHQLDVHERLILHSFRRMSIDTHKELLSHMLERAQHYNNAIVASGYAAFFCRMGLFSTRYQNDWYDASLVLMLLSVMVFVLWNVDSNIVMGNDLFQKAEIIGRNIHDPVYLTEALASFDKALVDRSMRRKNWWRTMLFLSVVPGVAAAIIWFYVVGSGILNRMVPRIQDAM